MKGREQDVTGLILAGGLSTRFGSNKTHHRIGDRSMIGHVHAALHPLVAEVLVSVRRIEDATDLPVRHVVDRYAGFGPLAGIHAGLTDCETEWLLVTPCDAPFLDRKVLAGILAAREGSGPVVARTPDGRAQPLVACYPRSILGLVEAQLNGKRLRMHDLLAACPEPVRHVRAPHRPLSNVNVPGDLL